MQATDIGHGRGWLDAPAAASLRRVDAVLGHPLQVTEAGRTRARQAELRALYEAGKGNYAAPPGQSPHEAGNAIDTDERLTLLTEHGWVRTLTFEPWHYVYNPARDRHLAAPTGAATTPTIPERTTDTMPNIPPLAVQSNTTDIWALLPDGTKRRVKPAEMDVYRSIAKKRGVDINTYIAEGVKLTDIPNAR